ncbi:hypothetical protein DVH26_19025 [Paenibacillus sp. H1-7]|uniref:hypothetical protein n=1 Tax=Paenibacillus sp. H1-7 TaxID=2282849 RepID=UPI001EF8712E|nr:hypothetical protein [Paenibacillus sp. H1-7]ULL16356.1 hypothetical protein DVH26_19025 [Paenibacillus sp. H1-7]
MINPYELEKQYEQHTKELEHIMRTAYLVEKPSRPRHFILRWLKSLFASKTKEDSSAIHR